MKAILFDLDDTLIPEAPALQAGYRAQAFEAALPPNARGTSPELVDLWRTMFHAALSALGASADEVVMVGNDVDRDVAGAHNVHIRPIHVDRRRRSTTTDVIADLTQLEDLLDV
jgi:FMN phosphatase YigB (HAD superfamily)